MVRSLALLALLIGGVAHAAEFKAAFVDIQRALQETEDGKAATARLKSLDESKRKALQKEQDSLMAEAATFEKQAPTMDEKIRTQKAQELQMKQRKLLDNSEKARAEVYEAQNKELAEITSKLSDVVAQIAQREGLTMVFTKDGLAWAPSSLDLTNELIRLYNAQAKAPPAKAPAAAPKK